jgi:hypothetical protein
MCEGVLAAPENRNYKDDLSCSVFHFGSLWWKNRTETEGLEFRSHMENVHQMCTVHAFVCGVRPLNHCPRDPGNRALYSILVHCCPLLSSIVYILYININTYNHNSVN